MQKNVKLAFKIILGIMLSALLIFLVVFSQRFYLKKAYPIKHTEFVEKYSKQYQLDELFVYALIRTESDFSQNATSSIGARGLMQITEETFDWIKGKLKDKESTFDSMYDAQTAVEYGCYLISYLKDTLGSEQNLLCGYHAGVNRAKSWLKDDEISQNGQIIVDKIPFPDTKQYVNKVMETYEMYKKLYEIGE